MNDGIFYTSVKVSPRQGAVPRQRCCWTAISVCDSALLNGPGRPSLGRRVWKASQERKGRQRASVRCPPWHPASDTRGRTGAAQGGPPRRAFLRQGAMTTPAPPPTRGYERAGRSFYSAAAVRRQDDARSNRRGAADGARVEAEVTRQLGSIDRHQYGRAAICKYRNVRVVTRTKSPHRRAMRFPLKVRAEAGVVASARLNLRPPREPRIGGADPQTPGLKF